MRLAMEMAGYDELRREQAEKRAKGEYMGIGISFFTEAVGAGPRKTHGHPRPGHGRRLRAARPSHRQGRAAAVGAEPGPGPRDDVRADRRRGARHPAGGHRGRPRRHRPDAVRPGHLRLAARRRCPARRRRVVARKVRDQREDRRRGDARVLARRPRVGARAAGSSRATRSGARRSRRSRCCAHGALELPEGVEGHLDATAVYNPPNLTYPYGCYICVVDVDPGTGQVKVRRFVAVDDCGTRINPMIVEGQVHGGLADGVGMALMELIAFDEDGNCLGGSLHGLPAAHRRWSAPTGSWARR